MGSLKIPRTQKKQKLTGKRKTITDNAVGCTPEHNQRNEDNRTQQR